MGLFGRDKGGSGSGNGEEETRLFFATDLHGSEVCFKKLMSTPAAYSTSTVIMGGDCTGKMLIPIIEDGDRWESSWAGEVTKGRIGDEVLDQYETRVRNTGLYPVRLSSEAAAELERDSTKLSETFTQAMLDTLSRWTAIAEERYGETEIHVIMTPGNDDEFSVDEVLRRSTFVDAAEGSITKIGRHEMLSVGWSNETPWDTPRECSEEELAGKIDVLAAHIEDMDNAIFNIHVPPYGTGLDEAPELDANMKPQAGMMAAVGSTAVRDAILKYQPLLSLHGHIHESRGVQKLGRTTAINPGSVYGDWTLQGVIVDLLDAKVARYNLTTG